MILMLIQIGKFSNRLYKSKVLGFNGHQHFTA